MRHSILHPGGHKARLLGIVVIGALVFAFGLVLSRCPGLSSRGATLSIKVPVTFHSVTDSGSVYLMDETAGVISVVGTFAVNDGAGHMDLKVPRSLIDKPVIFSGSYWTGNAKSYIPHFQFLFNDDLNHRLEKVLESAKSDPVVQDALARFGDAWGSALGSSLEPELRRLLEKPEVKRDLKDLVLMLLVKQVAKWRDVDLKEVPDLDLGKSEDALQRLLREHIGGSAEKLIRDISRDPAIRNAGDDLRKALEPHFTTAVMQIAWTGHDGSLSAGEEGIPNARVLWVARRIMFGSKNPAILLYANPDGAVLTASQTFTCTVAK